MTRYPHLLAPITIGDLLGDVGEQCGAVAVRRPAHLHRDLGTQVGRRCGGLDPGSELLVPPLPVAR